MEIVEKKRAAKKIRSENPEGMDRYRQLCREVKKATKQDKQRWIEQQCAFIESCHGNKKSREAYKTVRQLTGGYKRKEVGIKDKNGNKLTKEQDIRNRWTEYAKDIYKDRETHNATTLSNLQNRYTAERIMVEDDILRAEVEKAIRQLKDKKSPGFDEIPAELIKCGGEKSIDAIHRLCNMVWHQEVWPSSWTKSVLITIPKKGDLTDCANYRTIALISHASKVLLTIILERLKAILDPCMSEEQGGFRKDRNTVQQILTLRLINEKHLEREKMVYHCFVDYTKAFDSVWHDGLWTVLESYQVPQRLMKLMKDLYNQSELAVKINGHLGEWFHPDVGSRQGDPLSPLMFITLLERVMEPVECGTGDVGINIHGTLVKDLRFADDVDLLATTDKDLQKLISTQAGSSDCYGLKVNMKKTKVMVCSRNKAGYTKPKITIDKEELECVPDYIYLGSLINEKNDCSQEIRRRINLASQTLGMMRPVWKSSDISIKTKIDVLTTCVFSRLLYASETWTLKSEDERRLLAFEMRCYRRLLKVCWKDKIRNDDIRKKIQKQSTIIDVIKKRKLELFGHICRMRDDRLIRTVMMGMVTGNRRRGRPPKRWIDDIVNWCSCSLADAIRCAEDRKQWRDKIYHVTGLYGPSGT